MRPISTDVAWSECTSVCLLITAMSPTKSDETKWVSFENHVLCRSLDVSERGWHKQHTQRYSQDGSSDTASDYQYRSILYYIQMQLLPLFVWPGRVTVRMSDSLVQLPVVLLSDNNLGQVVQCLYTCASVNKLVPVKEWWRCAVRRHEKRRILNVTQ